MASLPYLFAGLQIAAPAAFLGAMVGEFTGAERGMGVLTIRAMRALDVDMTWALASVATAVAVAAYLAVGAMARRVLKDAPPIILAPPRAEGAEAGIGQLPLSLVAVAAAILGLWWGHRGLRSEPVLCQGTARCGPCAHLGPECRSHPRQPWRGAGRDDGVPAARYLAGLAAGAGLAILFVLAPAVAGTAMPLAIALRSVPIVTTAPLIVLMLGRGATGTIVLVAVMVFFPTLVACIHGLKQAPGQVIDVFDSYAAGRLQRLIRVRIPAMLPAFFAAARMGVPASVLAVTVVEWLATGAGLGSLMAISASVSDYNMLWSAVALTAGLSALGYAGVGLIEARILRIYAPEQLT